VTTSFDRLATALADRYRIERELGQGGMATVYLAEDVRHKRHVAVKVLRAELAAMLGPERFLREIETTASLRHPHILPLFDSGIVSALTAESPNRPIAQFLFYVMPFVEGESLRDRLARDRQLSIEDALKITREVADALGYAHSRGIIHRDIKPDNIMLERGHAVVADFGIARAVTSAGAEKLTQTGMAVGTPAYMSPEQSVGESDLDGRSDLYALGCVLYEMLAGEPPYSGPTAQAIIAKRFREPVPQVSTLRETVPPGLEAALTRVLAKAPADRFATAEDFLAAIADRPLSEAGTTGDSHARPKSAADTESETAAVRIDGDDGFRVAVLPFKTVGDDTALTSLGNGLSDEIASGLSRFSYLRVISRSATLQHALSGDAQSAGRRLGARYLMEGNLRSAGPRMRLTVQLVDTDSGAQLWAETYDRPFSPEAVFELQDDLVPRIVSAVGDPHGVLPHTMSESLRGLPPERLTPYQAVLRSFGYGYRMGAEEHAVVQAGLEHAVQQAPGYADAWAMLSLVYGEEYAHGFGVRPDPLGRALDAARRAAAAAPVNAIAHNAMARAHFFRKEFPAFRTAAERAIELNPLNGPTLAGLGSMLAYAGDWTRGAALVEQARGRHPRHPAWYWFPLFYNAYRQKDYQGALGIALKINLPANYNAHLALAAVRGQLGERDAAARAVQDLLTLRPDFAESARVEIGKWFAPELVEHLLEGLRKAGLEIAGGSAVGAAPSVAVLPFANMSADLGDEYFADGITEEIINALVQLPGLRVAARTSCFAFKGKNEDLRVVADRLGVNSVLEGSVRKAGSMLRVTAQLINAADGCHLWSERYDREMQDVFAMQDEIAGAIAARLQVSIASTAAPRSRPGNLAAYELLLKGRVLLGRRGRLIIDARACLEEAITLEPDNAEAHALLGDCYRLHAMYGMAPPIEMMPLARASAERAMELEPNHVVALTTLANVIANYDRDLARSAAVYDRVLTRDPEYVNALAERAICLSMVDDSPPRIDQALRDLTLARGLDPLNAWLAAIHAFVLTFAGRPDEALVMAQQGMMLDPANFTSHWALVLTLAALGRHAETLAAAEPALGMSGRNPRVLAEVAAVHAARGEGAAAEAVFQETHGRAQTSYIGWSEQGAIAASAGRLEEARALVRQGVEAREPFVLWSKLPSWAPFRADREGREILRVITA